MTQTNVRIVDAAVCPVGLLRGGHDGDSLRSNLLEDGRVFNVFNGFSFPVPRSCDAVNRQPQSVRNLVATLISSETAADLPLKLTHISNQLDGRDASDYGPAAVAQGFDASALDITRIVFEGGLCITYGATVDNALADGNPGNDTRNLMQAARDAKCPAVLLTAGAKLIAAGFRSAGFSSGSLSHLTFHKGGEYDPIRAEMTWIV